MQIEASRTRWMRCFAPVVWLAILQVIVFSLLSSSPEMHERIHSDAHDSGHHCLSTDFQSGTVGETAMTPIVATDFVPVVIGAVIISVAVRHFLPVHLRGSLLEHGPPALA